MNTYRIILLAILTLPLLAIKPAPWILVGDDARCKDQVGAEAATICSDLAPAKGVWICPEPGPCGETTAWVRTNLTTYTDCVNIDNPTSSTTYHSRWRSAADSTITEIWCETDTGTAGMDLMIDDGTPLRINGTSIPCVVSPGTTDVEFDNSATLAPGDTLDVRTGTVTSATRLSVCWQHTDD